MANELVVPATADLLASIPGADEADTGLGELTARDYKMPIKSLNKTGLGPDGRKLPQDWWYDSVLQTAKPTVHAVLCYLHKRNEYAVYDQATQKAKVYCSSQDTKLGVWRETGKERKCQGCPDARWGKAPDGKAHRNCDEVRDVFAFDLEEQRGFRSTFRRTSLKPLDEHLDRHHKRKRYIAGKGYSDYHLYSFLVALSAKMDPSGQFARPVITVERVVNAAEFQFFLGQAQYIAAEIIPTLGDASGEDDTSFDYGANSDDDDGTEPIPAG